MKSIILILVLLMVKADATPPTLAFYYSNQNLITLTLTAGDEAITGAFNVEYAGGSATCLDVYQSNGTCPQYVLQPGQSAYVAIGAIPWTNLFCETTTCPSHPFYAGNLPCGTQFQIQATLPDATVSNVLSASTQDCDE